LPEVVPGRSEVGGVPADPLEATNPATPSELSTLADTTPTRSLRTSRRWASRRDEGSVVT
jgi:hypothetical protein